MVCARAKVEGDLIVLTATGLHDDVDALAGAEIAKRALAGGSPAVPEDRFRLARVLEADVTHDLCPALGRDGQLRLGLRLWLAAGRVQTHERRIAVRLLCEVMVDKTLVRHIGARGYKLGALRMVLSLGVDTRLEPAWVMRLVQRKDSRWKLTPDMRLSYAFTEDERKDRMSAARARLREVAGCLAR
jgi:hypothetical protein